MSKKIVCDICGNDNNTSRKNCWYCGSIINKPKIETDIILIVDSSGSMQPLVKDTIGGIKSFVKDQKNVEGKAYLTLVYFNTEMKIVYERIPIDRISDDVGDDYKASGGTALLDAVCRTLDSSERVIPEENAVVVCVITDGEENSSVMFRNRDDVKSRVSKLKDKKWQFAFLGANVDSFLEGSSIGINTTQNWTFDNIGINQVYCTMSRSISGYRVGVAEDNDTKFVLTDSEKSS